MAHPVMFDESDPLLQRLREIAHGPARGRGAGLPRSADVRVGQAVRRLRRRRASPEGHLRHDHALLFVPEAGELAGLDADERFFVPAYYGPSGWRAVDLDRDDVDWDEVAELVDASYRTVANKRQLAALDAR